MPGGATILDGSSPKAKASGKTVTVAGPFPPGRTMIQAAAQVAASGASLELTQRFPANFEQLSIIIRKVGDTKLASPQISSQQDMTAQGEAFISAVGGSVAAGQPITFTIDNLPHHSAVPRWTALGLASFIIMAGVWTAKRPETGAAANPRNELIARRERLFADLMRLEHERRNGKIAQDRYAGRRETLMASLEQIYGALDDSAAGSGLAGQPA
jgi:hypothetical protein